MFQLQHVSKKTYFIIAIFLIQCFFMSVKIWEIKVSISPITGYNGIYTQSSVANPSVRYGMNAANNMGLRAFEPLQRAKQETYEIDKGLDDEAFIRALENFAGKMDAANDEYMNSNLRYQYSNVTKDGIDKLSLLGAAFEEMGMRMTLPVQQVNNILRKIYPEQNTKKKKIYTEIIDANNNGGIDIEEYGAFLAYADLKSANKSSLNPKNMQGVITQEGIKEAINAISVNPEQKGFFSKYKKNKRMFSKLTDELNLKEARQELKEETKHINFFV